MEEGMMQNAEQMAQEQQPAAPVQQQQPAAPVQEQQPAAQVPESSAPAPDQTQMDEQISGEEQQEYERGMEELKNVLYQNKQASDALIKMVHPDEKVETTSKTIIQLISQMDEKITLDESSVHSLTEEAVDRLTEMVEQSTGMKYTDMEIKQIMMTSWEGILGIFGGEEDMEPSYTGLASSVSDEDIKNGQQQYQEIMNG